MYGNPAYMNTPPFFPPFMWPPGPSQTPQVNPVEQISSWIKGLEELKKSMKEEKKDEKKEPKKPNASVVSMMLLMLLLSPVTGPAMFYFFQLSLGIIHK